MEIIQVKYKKIDSILNFAVNHINAILDTYSRYR